MPVNVFYIISEIEKSLAFEWITDGVDKNKINLHFILLGKDDTPLINFLKSRKVDVHVIPFRGKKDLISSWIKIYLILKKYRPDVVHAHLYYACLVGLTTAWLLRIPKRIHTRHHGSLHHQYFPRAVYIDKLINFLSTDIIVISTKQLEIVNVWERTPIQKIHLIPHGFDLEYFQFNDEARVSALRSFYNLSENAFVVGVISRYINWKGIQYIIPAFAKIKEKYPEAHLILANSHGNYTQQLKQLLSQLPKWSYTEIPFEQDIATLYKLFDVFVHVPVDEYCEAFGQTYVEALISGIPSVFTLSGIATEFIENEYNALVVPFRDSNSIAEAIKKIHLEKSLAKTLIRNGKRSVQQFSLASMFAKLDALYD